jgi:hypothetical protein
VAAPSETVVDVCTAVPYSTRITMADNASTDGTLGVAHGLADEVADVEVIHTT